MPTRLYLMICELDVHNLPAMVERRGHRTLVAWDARSLRVDITARLLDILTDEEIALMADGLGVSWPLPEWCVEARPALLYVPPALRLPGHGPIQGGQEKYRRARNGQLHLEIASLRAEQAGEPVCLQTVDNLAYAAA